MMNRLATMISVGLLGVITFTFPSPAQCQETAASATNTCFQGPFDFRDGITFYIANRDGVPFTLKLKSQNPFILVRVFDPEERLLFRKGFPDNVANGKTAPFGEVTLEVPARGKGVYEVIVTEGSDSKDLLDIATTPALPFGVFGHPVLYAARPGQFAESFVYLPPGLTNWNISVYQLWGDKFVVDELVVRDEKGGERLRLSGKGASGNMELPKDGTNVWRMSVKSKERIDLYFGKDPIGGDPIILCPDPETARFIHASVDRLEDGTICYHKFQVRAHEILKRYRQMPAYKFLVPIPDLNFYRASILREPLRNEELFVLYGALSNLAPLLEEQNLDPQSPWFGSMYMWRGKDGKALPGNPLSNYSVSTDELTAAMWINSLAVSYALDAPFNPLYKNEALLNRLIVAELQAWMALKETEFIGPMPSYLHYGSYAFRLGFYATPAFPLLIRDFPEDAKEVFTDGCRRLVDRMTFHNICNNVNQWTVGMYGFVNFYKGTGEDIYLKVLLNHLQWMYTCRMGGLGQMPAGYMAEANGPDSTYNGITGFHLAMIYHELKDLGRTDDARALLDSLRRSYFLFNHTVAPEPNGTWLGACSFCCRTPGDWTGPQTGAGLVFMGDDLPEAAVHAGRVWHFPKLPANDEELTKLREARDKDFGRYYLHFPADHGRVEGNFGRIASSYESFDIWKHFPSNVVPAKLPMEAEDRFERDFGGEFYAIRRPAYYALFYAAATAAQAQPENSDDQFQRAGGLCLFWSKDFGTSLLGKNWSTYTAHSLITVRPDGKTDWEELASIKNEFKQAPTTLTINGRLRNLPLRFQRVCTFPDDRVDIALTIEAEKAVTLKDFNECFPYPLEKPGQDKAATPLDVLFLDPTGETNRGLVQAVAFRSGSSPEVHLMVFDNPRVLDAGTNESTDHYDAKRKYGRILASLPLEWKEGEKKTFRLALIACKAAELKARVQKAVKDFSAP